MTPQDAPGGPAPASVLRNRSVLGIGLASFLSDAGHEMATAALPGFLRSLGAPAVALGVIEGVADASLSLAKAAGGMVADRAAGGRRKVAAAGYALTGVAYGSLALAGSWPFVAVARAAAWAFRGGRTPAREALLAASVPASHLGRAFGVERAGDSLGAIVGPLLAAAAVGAVGFRALFAVSVVPALLAAASILLVRERPAPRGLRRTAGSMASLLARGAFRRLTVAVGLYGLGNFAATLLILRATELLAQRGYGPVRAATVAVFLYAAHNAANAVAAYPAGHLADRLGRRPVLAVGMALFGAACFLLALGAAHPAALGALFVAVGTSTGMVETARGSHAAEVLPEEVRGRGFGLLGLVDGVGDLVSSLVVGALWTFAAPAWGFLYAGALATLGAGALLRPLGPRGGSGAGPVP
ncbi:MAG TPA: MFS transporter [Actinomycetota bacterium]|nr:MFS transporter [Actinomycetota bacterium]